MKIYNDNGAASAVAAFIILMAIYLFISKRASLPRNTKDARRFLYQEWLSCLSCFNHPYQKLSFAMERIPDAFFIGIHNNPESSMMLRIKRFIEMFLPQKTELTTQKNPHCIYKK